jgi:sRNA-binding carbon storage regulator CsrA
MLVMDIKLNEGLVIGNDILLLLRQSIIVKNAVQHGCKALNRC